MNREFLFDSAPFPTCHAATIVDTGHGLIVAWFVGEEEGSPDVGIWTSHHDGKQWSKPMEVASGLQENGSRYACWNPVLFAADSDRIMLFYRVGKSPRSWWGMLMRSNDRGTSWLPAQRLPHDILGPIKNKPVKLSDGTLLCGSSSEQAGWAVHMEMTPDLGRTWTRTDCLNDSKKLPAIQPTILKYPSGELQILCRTRIGNIAESWSMDQCRSWSKMELTQLPNPDSGIDGIVLRDGRALLVYNPSERERSPLSVALSSDGKNWRTNLVLEDEAGEYSYPAVLQTSDELVHIAYTWNRNRIKHVVIDPKEIGF